VGEEEAPFDKEGVIDKEGVEVAEGVPGVPATVEVALAAGEEDAPFDKEAVAEAATVEVALAAGEEDAPFEKEAVAEEVAEAATKDGLTDCVEVADKPPVGDGVGGEVKQSKVFFEVTWQNSPIAQGIF